MLGYGVRMQLIKTALLVLGSLKRYQSGISDVGELSNNTDFQKANLLLSLRAIKILGIYILEMREVQ